MSESITMEELKSNMCRWPFGDPQEDDFHFCGTRRAPESSYCQTHTKEAYKAANYKSKKQKQKQKMEQEKRRRNRR